MTKKSWAIFAILTVGLLGGLVWMSSGNKINVDNVNTSEVVKTSEDNGNIKEHIYGKEDAKLTVIEYGDFQCPGCAGVAPILKEVIDKNPDKYRLIFRNFPLTSIHPNAKYAASIAEASANQGKYWEMHELLFSKRTEWENLNSKDRIAKMEEYAKSLGMDASKLTSDAASENIAKKITYDQALGKKDGITGTPHIVVNGEQLNSSDYSSVDTLTKKLEEISKK